MTGRASAHASLSPNSSTLRRSCPAVNAPNSRDGNALVAAGEMAVMCFSQRRRTGSPRPREFKLRTPPSRRDNIAGVRGAIPLGEALAPLPRTSRPSAFPLRLHLLGDLPSCEEVTAPSTSAAGQGSTPTPRPRRRTAAQPGAPGSRRPDTMNPTRPASACCAETRRVPSVVRNDYRFFPSQRFSRFSSPRPGLGVAAGAL